VELSDDGRFAVHFSEDGRSLVRISLGDRTIASLPVDAPAPRWIGLRAVRGAPRVVAWDGAHLVVVDLVTASVVAGVAVERLQSVDDATVERVVVSHGPLQHELLELASGRRLPLSGGTRPPVLTPDGGRCLRHSSHVLDVIDTATGAVFRPHRGHRDTIRDLVWSRDGTRVATAADDGRIRVLHLGDPGAITELVTHRGKLDFTPDGRHLCTVSSSEIAVWDAATGAVLGRCPSFGTHIHSAEVSADGRRVLTGSYSHGIRVVDLATGAHVVIEREATARCTHAVFVGDHIVACGRERVDTLSPVDLVHWTLLDERGLVLDRGGWQLEGRRFNGIEVCFGDATAVVTAYQHAVHEMHTFDLSDPTAAARVVSIPRGAKVLDVRNGRVLLRDVSDLVCLDAATGAELERMHCVRKPWAASLSRDGSHIAVAYTDQGVEVLEMLEAPEVPEAR
jgi:WD40 repeat protein